MRVFKRLFICLFFLAASTGWKRRRGPAAFGRSLSPCLWLERGAGPADVEPAVFYNVVLSVT